MFTGQKIWNDWGSGQQLCISAFDRYADWREPELEKKLHLSNSVKGDVARDIVNIFKKLGERST